LKTNAVNILENGWRGRICELEFNAASHAQASSAKEIAVSQLSIQATKQVPVRIFALSIT